MTRKILLIVLLALGAVIAIGGLIPRKTASDFDVDGFATLTALEGGRLKPLDSVARNSLLILRGKQNVVLEDGTKISAAVWLMDVLMRPMVAASYPIFRIDHPDVLGLFGIEQEDEKYFSLEELRSFLPEIQRQFELANPEPRLRTPYERAVVKLHAGITLYQRLLTSLVPPPSATAFADEYDAFLAAIPDGMEAFERQQRGEEYDAAAFSRFVAFVDRYRRMSEEAHLRIVPPLSKEAGPDGWETVGQALGRTLRTGEIDPAVVGFASMADAYRADDPETFNTALTQVEEEIAARCEIGPKRIAFEHYFNDSSPFLRSQILYVMVFLLAAISWMAWGTTLSRAALGLMAMAAVLHTFGIIARMVIQGYAPVTNLYSSAVYIGWFTVVLCIVLEAITKRGFAAAVGGLVGFSTLVVASALATSGDTLEMMRAVLDSNFWLATHVLTVTKGYSATFLAGALGAVFILLGLFTRKLDAGAVKVLNGMAYGVVCFALLFSFVGTVLGGIWADQSWGRFWGWDPKENGALMIVLWNAVILHARWGGMIRARGLMVLTLVGNIITCWSWFGTNLLGVGLHSYGFTEKGFVVLSMVIGGHLVLIGLGCLPTRFWSSPAAVGLKETKTKEPAPAGQPSTASAGG